MRVVACSRYPRPIFLKCLRKVKGSYRTVSLFPISAGGCNGAWNGGLYEWMAHKCIYVTRLLVASRIRGLRPTPRKKSLVHRGTERCKRSSAPAFPGARSASQPQNTLPLRPHDPQASRMTYPLTQTTMYVHHLWTLGHLMEHARHQLACR